MQMRAVWSSIILLGGVLFASNGWAQFHRINIRQNNAQGVQAWNSQEKVRYLSRDDAKAHLRAGYFGWRPTRQFQTIRLSDRIDQYANKITEGFSPAETIFKTQEVALRKKGKLVSLDFKARDGTRFKLTSDPITDITQNPWKVKHQVRVERTTLDGRTITKTYTATGKKVVPLPYRMSKWLPFGVTWDLQN